MVAYTSVAAEDMPGSSRSQDIFETKTTAFNNSLNVNYKKKTEAWRMTIIFLVNQSE